jgi:hypothetical protein
MDNMKHRRLQELDRSDFEIVDGEPDIRGWDVKNTAGQKIGEVEELIVDAQQKKVRYMVVDLDDNELKLDHRKVLLPIGLAQLHRDDDDVILPNVQETQLRSLPDYDEDHLTPDLERRICSNLGRQNLTAVTGTEEHTDDFYKHDYYNDDNLYKNRLHEARPVQKAQSESEYENGLRLWQKRSEGGILPNDETGRGSSRSYEQKEINEDARMEMVRNRRNTYEQKRAGGLGRNQNGNDNTIEGRIRREGLQ